MAGPIIGYQGIVTSWAGTANTALIGAIGEHTATLNISGGTADRTQFAASLVGTSMGAGLRSWEATLSARLLTSGAAQIGYLGSVAISGSDAYTLHGRRWSMNFNVNAIETPEFGSTAVVAGWTQFLRGLMDVTGDYTVLVDDTTALKMPFTPTTSLPTGTFTLNTGNTLAGELIPTALNIGEPVNSIAEATYGYKLNGTLTAAGTGNLFAAGSVALPDFDYATPANNNLVFTMASGRTLTGPGFWKSLSISVDPAQYIDIGLTIQGYGALTPG